MNPGGNGLGLNISKTIAKKLKGDLTFISELGQGTCFTLVLPLKKSLEKSISTSKTQSLDDFEAPPDENDAILSIEEELRQNNRDEDRH